MNWPNLSSIYTCPSPFTPSQKKHYFLFFPFGRNPKHNTYSTIHLQTYMASSSFSTKLPLALFLSSLFLHAAIAELVCEDLPSNVCAFAIASSGKRCLLETAVVGEKSVEYQCRTSEVVVEGISEYIETDQCVKACGVDRKAVGISSDALLEPQVTTMLCSPDCYQKCPNIVDLYSNLAAGEGVSLPDLCERQRTNPHRAMSELLSSGSTVAPGPVVTDQYSGAATSAPTSSPAPAPL